MDRGPHIVSSGPRLRYLPGLDGLRAIAVSAVLLYHADLPWMPGGYLGVEVFFALSGYLITSLLVSEWRAHGRIDLGAFWLRRARRLLPALFLLLAAVLTFNVMFLPDEVANIRGDALAATFYVTNWFQVFAQRSYFEIMGRPPMLQHLWSLAVEEQFYLLWPLLFVGMARRWRLNRGVLAATLAGAVASAGLMALLYQPDVDPSRIYYGTDTRAAGLLLGCALALAWTPAPGPRKPGMWGHGLSLLTDLAGLAALAVLGGLFVWLDETQPFLYQGGFVLCAAATLVGIAVCAGRWARFVPWLLGLPLLRWVGTRSYGIYLWHWPVFMVTRPQLDLSLEGMPLLVLRLGVTLLLAELSYRFVETPIRRGALGRAWRTLRESAGAQKRQLAARWALSGLAVMVFSAGLIFSLGNAAPPTPPDYLASAAAPSPTSTLALALPATATLPVAPPTAPVQPTVTQAPATATSVPTVIVAQVVASPTPVAPATPTRTVAPPTATRPPSSTPTQPPAPTSTPTPAAATSPVTTAQPEAHTPEPALTPSVEPVVTGVALEGTPQGDSAASVLDPGAGDPTSTTGSAPALPVTPTVPPAPAPPPPSSVLAVGDSVMLGAQAELRKQIPHITVDAAVGRQALDMVNLLKWRASTGRLGEVVVVHTGTNGYFTAKQFDQIMQALSGVRRVVFVNDKVPRRWEGSNDAVIAAGVQRYPNAVLVDWYSATANQPTLFSKDGTHPQLAGQRLYARLILEGINRP